MPWRHHFAVTALVAFVAGCTSYESAYERHVYDEEPIYCYQSLAGVSCYRRPYARDADRLVNYYGPAPSKYDPPDPPEESDLALPTEGPGYERDPEPTPGSWRSEASASRVAPSGSDGSTPAGPAATTTDDDWRSWLPVLSAVFGALQVVSLFAF